MNRLVIDTSTEAFSVAVISESDKSDDNTEAECQRHFEIAPRKHGELLLPTVDRLLQQANLTISDIDQVIYGRGPGAFTGIRIAISAAQGLAYGIDCPLVGISSLQNLALQAFDQTSADYAVVAMDARMGEIYYAIYRRNTELLAGNCPELIGEEQVLKPDTLLSLESQIKAFDSKKPSPKEAQPSKITAIGTGWSVYPDILCQQLGVKPDVTLADKFPDAYYSGILARLVTLQATQHSAEQAVPVYLRNNVAAKSSKPSILKR
ncbi:tRNA (adenosine(37)-N6)-threonylcarbamoyltransferase complex dimerization subunit type 1 TsaB [Pleionea mediterranea]|uniref:tRNA threonylcarbamoyladenosine biosynthesis protein TsaB n=1 Tax=Pleionea mediterranea TaxID=523701 RepID=A0A316FQQ3_9GAMM|nr:tRNA (adenosine(37)-N6)-threonylcarbamoyltransferase complex dimerization subunit type 1 TsaB [Pleionea mediterranea]PWK49980.1 tRNA threonylcarbamoyladenosine biosynthesis protein TsaB [Pleionea mediterranea]